MRLIDGPIDPNSGAHMARRYAEVIPDADVVMLADDIGHWPQLEAPDAVLDAFSRPHRPRHRRQLELGDRVLQALGQPGLRLGAPGGQVLRRERR